MDNANTKDYLDKIRNQVVENLKRTAFAPSVQMTDVPRNPLLDGMDDEADDILDDMDEDENKDKRFTQRRFDQYVEKAGELSESEDEEENAANGIRRQPNAIRRKNQANYRNLDADSGLDSGLATPQAASSVGDTVLDTALDTNMTDAPKTELDVSVAAVGPNGQGTPGTDIDQMVIEGEEKVVSAAVSQLPSPVPHDEDTMMEDAGAPAPEAEQTEPISEIDKERRPDIPYVADGAARTTSLSPRAKSPPKDTSTTATEEGEKSTQEPAPAETSESVKAASPETSDKPKKEE